MIASKQLFWILLTFFISITDAIHAGVVTWDDDAMDKKWMNPSNWDGDVLPTATDDVIIPLGFSVTMDAVSTIQSLHLSGSLIIESLGAINVFVGVPNGVNITGGELNVEGTLNVSLADFNGIEISGVGKLSIKNGGSVTVDQIGDAGITLSGNSVLSVLFGGDLTISKVDVGIQLAAGHASNQGVINISESNSLFGASGVFLSISSSFRNLSTGSLDISEFGMFASSKGIRTLGEFTNTGSITIGNVTSAGIENTGSFINAGDITITTANGAGIQNSIPGTFENQSSGEISVSGLLNQLFSCIRTDGISFTNAGRIEMTNFRGRGIFSSNLDSLINSGNIIVNTNDCLDPITNISTFINLTNGTISINANIVNSAIGNSNILGNHGTINIDIAGGTNGIRNNSSGSLFANFGTLDIEAGDLGIRRGVYCATESIFNNSGAMNLNFNKLDEIAIEVSGGSTLTNTNAGIITILILSSSLGDLMSVTSNSTFDDSGQFTVEKY